MIAIQDLLRKLLLDDDPKVVQNQSLGNLPLFPPSSLHLDLDPESLQALPGDFPIESACVIDGFEGIRVLYGLQKAEYRSLVSQMRSLGVCPHNTWEGMAYQLSGHLLKEHPDIAFIRLFRFTSEPRNPRTRERAPYGFLTIVGRTEKSIVDVVLADRGLLRLNFLLGHRPRKVEPFSRSRIIYDLHPFTKKFMGIFLPNTMNCIAWSQRQGWTTVGRRVRKEWMISHLAHRTFEPLDWFQAEHLGSAPHPGGWWDHEKKKWRGGLRVQYISWDFDCCEGDLHLARAKQMRLAFRAAGGELLLMNSSDVVKNGATFPGIRAVAVLSKPLHYSIFRWLAEGILEVVLNMEEEKGRAEIYPSRDRGSRCPLGLGCAVFDWEEGNLFWQEEQKENVEALLSTAVDLEAVGACLGVDLEDAPEEVLRPWLVHIRREEEPVKEPEQVTSVSSPVPRNFQEKVEKLLETGLTHSGHRWEATLLLTAYYRMLGMSRAHTVGHISDFLWNNHNGKSNFINKHRSTELASFVRSVVHDLYTKPFACEGRPELLERKPELKPREKVVAALLPLDVAQIKQQIEKHGESVPGYVEFLLEVMCVLKERIVKSEGDSFWVSSAVFRRASQHQKYSHYLALAAEHGFFRVSSHSYRVKDRRRPNYPPYVKRYFSSFIFASEVLKRITSKVPSHPPSTQQPLVVFLPSFLTPKDIEGGVRLLPYEAERLSPKYTSFFDDGNPFLSKRCSGVPSLSQSSLNAFMEPCSILYFFQLLIGLRVGVLFFPRWLLRLFVKRRFVDFRCVFFFVWVFRARGPPLLVFFSVSSKFLCSICFVCSILSTQWYCCCYLLFGQWIGLSCSRFLLLIAKKRCYFLVKKGAKLCFGHGVCFKTPGFSANSLRYLHPILNPLWVL